MTHPQTKVYRLSTCLFVCVCTLTLQNASAELQLDFTPIGVTEDDFGFGGATTLPDGTIVYFGGGQITYNLRQGVNGPFPTTLGQGSFLMRSSFDFGETITNHEIVDPFGVWWPAPFGNDFFAGDLATASIIGRITIERTFDRPTMGGCLVRDEQIGEWTLDSQSDSIAVESGIFSWTEGGIATTTPVRFSDPIEFIGVCVSGGDVPISLDLSSKFVAQIEANVGMTPSGLVVGKPDMPSSSVSVDLNGEHHGEIRVGLEIDDEGDGVGVPEFGTISSIVDPDLQALGNFNYMYTANVAYADQFQLHAPPIVIIEDEIFWQFGVPPKITSFAVVLGDASQVLSRCDADGDGDCGLDDINALYAQSGLNGPFDLDGSGLIDSQDTSLWLAAASHTGNPAKTNPSQVFVIGDVNLDGSVGSDDLGLALNNFGSTNGVGWSGGDLNMDQTVDSGDLGLILNGFGSTSAAAVPEPSSCLLMAFLLFGLADGARRRGAVCSPAYNKRPACCPGPVEEGSAFQ